MKKETHCRNCGKFIDRTVEKHRKSFYYCSHYCFCEHRKSKRDKFYSVETPCACGCGGIIMNPDDHYRYRKFLPEHRNAGGTHGMLGRKENEKHLEKRIKAVHKHFQKKEPTCIEKELYEFLDNNNLDYTKQKQIGRYIPDAFIQELNLCVFADGLYWHTKPEVVERDKRANKTLIERGYNVIRLPSIHNGYKLDLEPLKQLLQSNSI